MDDWDDIEEGSAAPGKAPAAPPGSAKGHGAPAAPSSYSGGIGFGDEDPFADGANAGSLELDLPAGHGRHQSAPNVALPASQAAAMPPDPAPMQPPHFSAPPASQPQQHPQQHHPQVSAPPVHMPAPMPPSSSHHPAASQQPPSQSQPQIQLAHVPNPRDPAVMIARFPAPPQRTIDAPLYALKVLWRKFELSQDIASLKKKRSPDVALYEQATRTHDAKAFAVGLAITCAAFAVASFIFFLPVLLRFLRDPD